MHLQGADDEARAKIHYEARVLAEREDARLRNESKLKRQEEVRASLAAQLVCDVASASF